MEDVRVESKQATIDKAVLVRIAPKEDVFEALRAACEREDIRYGHIAMIGSLRSASVVAVTGDPKNPGRAVYLEPTHFEGFLELVTVQGFVGENETGDREIHLHVVLAGEDLKPVAGHLADTGRNRVLATVEAVITSYGGAKFVRALDGETGFVLFRVR